MLSCSYYFLAILQAISQYKPGRHKAPFVEMRHILCLWLTIRGDILMTERSQESLQIMMFMRVKYILWMEIKSALRICDMCIP